MTTVTTANAAICTQKLLTNPALLCVHLVTSLSCHIPRASLNSCVLDRHATLRCILNVAWKVLLRFE